ncbi:MAG TPA: radical SAM protein [Candidatus Marinimicrobia bacterium]|nr:radical SAM protein [Candidatus Neomarinimicrobiota bacterium]
MKIYLIQPPIEDFYTTPIRNIPQGLLALAANLPKYEINLLDLRSRVRREIVPPPELASVRQFYRPDDASPFGLYKRYYRFGLSEMEIRQTLPRDGDYYLISSLFITYAETVFELIRLIREIVLKSKIIVGGAAATIQPREFLEQGADFVIKGEGELALPRLLNELEKDQPSLAPIPNLVWRDKTGVIQENPVNFIEDLNSLPSADYQTPGTPTYYYQKKPHAILITSRGCPHHCSFCCIHQTMGSRYRLRSVENVLNEMAEKIAQGFRSFDFEDDHLGGERDWFLALLKGIAERFTGLNLSLQAMNGITATNLDDEILTAMWRAGFRSLNLALVTPSEAHQRQVGRPFGTEQYLKVVECANKLGFFITTYLIIGLPGDRAEELLESILFLAPLPVLIGPALFYLVPGTASFQQFSRLGLIPSSVLCYRSSFYPVDSKECSRVAAMTLFRICRILNFMREVIDNEKKPHCPEIESDRIFLEKDLNGRESRYSLGLGLLKLLFERGILYGTGRKEGNFYPIIREICDQKMIERFLSSTWQISGLHRPTVFLKDEFVRRFLLD